MVDPEPLVEERLELEPDSVTVRPGLDEDVCRESRKAVGDRPDVEVVRLDDPGCRDRRPNLGRRADSGAPSRKIRPDSRRSDHAAANMSAATSSEAIGSSRFQPVTRMRSAARPCPRTRPGR